jgi:glycosyltransferase involved in cell wall biosynthesis
MSATRPARQPSQASISVIVPTYNSARFIGEALDSILAQRLQPEQIIVVDDGSTDSTAKVVGRYKDRRIQYIHQPHAGLASARNVGLDAARGEYVTFLDAADRWRPIFLEMLHTYLSEDPTAGSIFSNFVRFEHGTGKLLGDQFHRYPEIKRPVLLKDEPFAHGRIPREKAFSALVGCGEIPAYPQVMMFRRSMIENLRFDKTPGEDVGFALRAFLAGGVLFTDVVLAEVRCHEGNTVDPIATMLNRLEGLKAVEPHITRDSDRRAYRERLVKEHIATGVLQARAGQVRAGLRTFRDGFRVPGSTWRKFKGAMQMLLAVPRGLTR